MLKLLQPGKRPPSEELAARDLLEGGGVEDVVSARHRRADALQVPHVADVELYLVRHVGELRLVLVAHIVLLLLVAREDPDLRDVGPEEAPQHGVAEAAGAAGDHQCLSCKNAHIFSLFTLFSNVSGTRPGVVRPRGRRDASPCRAALCASARRSGPGGIRNLPGGVVGRRQARKYEERRMLCF